MGLGKSLKKATGGITKALSNPLALAASPITALTSGGFLGLGGGGDFNPNMGNPGGDQAIFEAMAQQEEAKRQALGKQQQGQINEFANTVSQDAAKRRATLVTSLSDIGQKTFQRMNPSILEDLNSRGLFTSQTARDQEQGRVLGDLSRDQASQLNSFDTDIASQLSDIRGTGLSAMLGGDQSALDSALALRKSGIERSFNVADTNAANSLATQLAKQQNKNQLLTSLIGAGGSIFTGRLGR